MSFLDNLENNLKSLESREERTRDDGKQREADRARSLASAPWAEKLKKSEWTQRLLADTMRAGHATRTKIFVAWLGNTLRLEARGRRLELRPASGGVELVFAVGTLEDQRGFVDFESDPAALLDSWLSQPQE